MIVAFECSGSNAVARVTKHDGFIKVELRVLSGPTEGQGQQVLLIPQDIASDVGSAVMALGQRLLMGPGGV